MKISKKILSVLLAVMFVVAAFAGCSSGTNTEDNTDTNESTKTFKVGICNYVDDASLNQINENIQAQLKKIGEENGVTFDIKYDNCNADSNVLAQIVSNFVADDVDLMVGIATPVAMAMQSETDEIPIIFAAVSDPIATNLVADKDAPGANITGTSDYLNTDAIMDIIFANDADADNIALLYDMGQDSSKSAIDNAKTYLDKKGVSYKEYTGTNVTEVQQAVASIVNDKCSAVFTPSDNTIMTAELSIYEDLAKAGIPHYAGADSFALNGAFMGYGVDYAALGVETAQMIAEVLIEGKDTATLPVKYFDNGTATFNTETCDTIGFNYAEVEKNSTPFCTEIKTITTAESFDSAE